MRARYAKQQFDVEVVYVHQTVNELLDDLVEHYKFDEEKGIRREINPQMQSHLKRVREYFGTMIAVKAQKQHINGFISSPKNGGKTRLLTAPCNCSGKPMPSRLMPTSPRLQGPQKSRSWTKATTYAKANLLMLELS